MDDRATLCPIHGSALCPEDYMLLSDGTPRADYAAHWHEGMRCGLRRPVRLLCASEYRGSMGEWDVCGLHPFHDGKHDGAEFDWTDAESLANGSARSITESGHSGSTTDENGSDRAGGAS